VTKNGRAAEAADAATQADDERPATEDRTEFQLGSVGLDSHWAGRILASDALFVTDEDQRIRTWSAGAQRVLGYTAEQVVGKRCYEVVMGRHPEGHPVCSRDCHVTRNAGHGRGTAAYEVMSTGPDGATHYLSTSVLVLEEKRGTFRVIHLMHESREAPPTRPAPAAEPAGDVGEVLARAESLTRREIEVLRLFARGSSLEAVAEALSISVLTARNHASNIQHKLGVNNRLQMVLEGLRRGLI
jgi:PAS domain S-box-containing protein